MTTEKPIDKVIKLIYALPKTAQAGDAIYAISNEYNLDLVRAVNLYNVTVIELQKRNNPLNIRMRFCNYNAKKN